MDSLKEKRKAYVEKEILEWKTLQSNLYKEFESTLLKNKPLDQDKCKEALEDYYVKHGYFPYRNDHVAWEKLAFCSTSKVEYPSDLDKRLFKETFSKLHSNMEIQHFSCTEYRSFESCRYRFEAHYKPSSFFK